MNIEHSSSSHKYVNKSKLTHLHSCSAFILPVVHFFELFFFKLKLRKRTTISQKSNYSIISLLECTLTTRFSISFGVYSQVKIYIFSRLVETQLKLLFFVVDCLFILPFPAAVHSAKINKISLEIKRKRKESLPNDVGSYYSNFFFFLLARIFCLFIHNNLHNKIRQ